MKKNLYILINIVAVLFFTVLLTNEITFVNSNIIYIEVLECEIEEEEENIHPFSEYSDIVLNFSGDDGAKKVNSSINNIELKKNLIDILINYQTFNTRYTYTSHLPKYILYCSIVVYT